MTGAALRRDTGSFKRGLLAERQDPVGQILDLGLVLGLEDLVLLFLAILELDHLAGREVMQQLGFRIGLALEGLGDLGQGLGFLLLVHGVALGTAFLLGQGLGGVGVQSQGAAGGQRGRQGGGGKTDGTDLHRGAP